MSVIIILPCVYNVLNIPTLVAIIISFRQSKLHVRNSCLQKIMDYISIIKMPQKLLKIIKFFFLIIILICIYIEISNFIKWSRAIRLQATNTKLVLLNTNLLC